MRHVERVLCRGVAAAGRHDLTQNRRVAGHCKRRGDVRSAPRLTAGAWTHEDEPRLLPQWQARESMRPLVRRDATGDLDHASGRVEAPSVIRTLQIAVAITVPA